jgi:hypothetical protein
MSPPAAGTWLAIYQPLIVGLGAVVLGLIANSAFEWVKQLVSESRRARAIRRILLHELLHFQRAAAGALEKEASPPAAHESMLVPIAEHFPAYDHHLKDLGLLRLAEIGAVVEAYAYVRAIPEWLVVIAPFKRTEHLLTAVVPSDQAHVLFGINRKVLAKLETATNMLQRRQ